MDSGAIVQACAAQIALDDADRLAVLLDEFGGLRASTQRLNANGA